MRQRWVDVHEVAGAVRSHPDTVVMVFTDHYAAEAFMHELCTGHELVQGGVHHDEGVHCPVHMS